MVTVDKYVRKLLFEYDCVIIPEFGGILKHHIGVQYDPIQATFEPARKRLAFNEVLKIDDGLLTYYISLNEKMPREKAALFVKEYVDFLRQQLSRGYPVTIDCIGKFTSNSEGKLVFEPDYSQNYNQESFGFKPLCAQEICRLPILDSAFPVASTEFEIVVSDEVAETVNLRPVWAKWTAAAVLAGCVVALSLLTRPVAPSLLSSLNPLEVFQINQLEPNSPVSGTEYQPESSVVPIIPVTVVSDSEKEDQWVVNPTIPQPTVKVPVGSKIVTEEAGVPAAIKNYFLIAGSFGRMKNATELKRQLLRDGFAETTILAHGEGKLIKVSAGAYSSVRSALGDKNRLDAVTGEDSWVYERK